MPTALSLHEWPKQPCWASVKLRLRFSLQPAVVPCNDWLKITDGKDVRAAETGVLTCPKSGFTLALHSADREWDWPSMYPEMVDVAALNLATCNEMISALKRVDFAYITDHSFNLQSLHKPRLCWLKYLSDASPILGKSAERMQQAPSLVA